MSEFTNHKENRIKKLVELFLLVIKGELSTEMVGEYQPVIDLAQPGDVIGVVDELVQLQIPMPQLKTGVNKALNLLNKSLQNFPYQAPEAGSFLHTFIQNNIQVDQRLKAIRPLLKLINQDITNEQVRNELKDRLVDLLKIDLHYQIKENVLFPVIEKHLSDYRCLQVMWSFHDDIRRNLKETIQMLDTANFDLKKFNRLAGDIFFNIYAIKFREERILFPIVSQMIPEKELNSLTGESLEIGFPFVQPEKVVGEVTSETKPSEDVDLKSGHLSAEQIRLLFNHLPVDITYVDENNKV
ncbi:MAG: hemerythrin domain-containing protein, partial [Candidatus Saccharibacteria bacterium]